MKQIRIREILDKPALGTELRVNGWVRTFRSRRFIALNDGSCLRNLQIVVDFEKMDSELLDRITTGSCLSITGKLVESQGAGQKVELICETLEVLGTAEADPQAEHFY